KCAHTSRAATTATTTSSSKPASSSNYATAAPPMSLQRSSVSGSSSSYEQRHHRRRRHDGERRSTHQVLTFVTCMCLYTENAWPEGGDPGASEEEEELEEEALRPATPSRRCSNLDLSTPFANPPIRVGLADRFLFDGETTRAHLLFDPSNDDRSHG